MRLLLAFLLFAVSHNISDSESLIFSPDRPLLPAQFVQRTVHHHYYHHPATLGVAASNVKGVVPILKNSRDYQGFPPYIHTVDPSVPLYRLADGSIYRGPTSGTLLVRPTYRSGLIPVERRVPQGGAVNYNASHPLPSIIGGSNMNASSTDVGLGNGGSVGSNSSVDTRLNINNIGGRNSGNIIGGNIGYTGASIGVSQRYPFIRNPHTFVPQLNVAPTQPFRFTHSAPIQFNPAHFKPGFTGHIGFPTFTHNIGGTHVGTNYLPPGNYYKTAPHPAFNGHTFSPNFNGNIGGNIHPYSGATVFPPAFSHSEIHYKVPSQPRYIAQPGFPNFESNTGSHKIGGNNLGGSTVGSIVDSSNTVGRNTEGSSNLGGNNNLGITNLNGNSNIGNNNNVDSNSNDVDSNSNIDATNNLSGTNYVSNNITLGNNNISGNNNVVGSNDNGSNTLGINNVSINNLDSNTNNNNIGDSNQSTGVTNTDSNPGFYVGGDFFDNVAGGIVSPYLSQARVGQLDPYPYKQLCGEARPFKRILITCYSNGQCQNMELEAVANDGRSQDLARMRSPVVKDKCRQPTTAKRPAGEESTDEIAVRSRTKAKRPRDRRLIPYSEVVLKQYPFN